METISGLNTVWVLLAAMFVFWMQPGFALVEAGFTRKKNTANILMKNFMDFMTGSFLYWFIGFGIMFGSGHFMGLETPFTTHWFDKTALGMQLPTEAYLIFQTVFCATASTIVSGAMAERTKFSMYIVYSVIISAIIYPISGHWIWGGGWLSNLGFHDFAGSTVVHSIGGWLALVGAAVIGPRIGKYSKKGEPKAIPGHNLTLAALGVFILWLGWFGFNPGSTVAAEGEKNATAIAHIFFTTNIAAAMGGLATLFTTWFKYGKPSLSMTLNGILAGLVGVTAGCDIVNGIGAAIIGSLCGIVMLFSINFIEKTLKIDDPVGASSIHGVCGFLGTILTGFLATEGGILYGGGFDLLKIQVLGAISILIWAGGTGFLLFKLLDKFFKIRVETRIEEEGLDLYEHGENAYN